MNYLRLRTTSAPTTPPPSPPRPPSISSSRAAGASRRLPHIHPPPPTVSANAAWTHPDSPGRSPFFFFQPGRAAASTTPGLNTNKLSMGIRLLQEAVEEDAKGADAADLEYVVHLCATALSMFVMSIPPHYLAHHPAEWAVFYSTLGLGAGPTGPNLAQGDLTSQHANEGPEWDWKEVVVKGLVALGGWLRHSGILTHISLAFFCIFRALKAVWNQLNLQALLITLISAAAQSRALSLAQDFVLDIVWIVFESFRRGAGQVPPG